MKTLKYPACQVFDVALQPKGVLVKSVPVELLERLIGSLKSGHIRDEHLEALLANPDSVLTGITTKLLHLLRRGDAVQEVYTTASFIAVLLEAGGVRRLAGNSGQSLIEEIGEFLEVDRTLYMTCRHGDAWWVMRGKAKPVGPYAEIRGFQVVDGKPLYAARIEQKWQAYWGDQTSPVFDEIQDLCVCRGKLLYRCREGQMWMVMWGTHELWGQEHMSRLQTCGSSPFFSFQNAQGWHLWYRGQINGPYTELLGPLNLTDGPVYWASSDGGWRCYWYSHASEFVSDTFDGIIRFCGEDRQPLATDKPLYVAARGGRNVVMYGDTTMSTHDSVDAVVSDAKMILVTDYGRQSILFGGERFDCPGYPCGLRSIGGKLFYDWLPANSQGKGYYVRWGDKDLACLDHAPTEIQECRGQPLFAGVIGGEWVFWGEQKFGPYDEVFGLDVGPGNLPLYAAAKDGLWHVYWGNRQFGSYHEVYEFNIHACGGISIIARKKRRLLRIIVRAEA